MVTARRSLGAATLALLCACASAQPQTDWASMNPIERNAALFRDTPARWLRLQDAIVQFVSLEPDGEPDSPTPILFVHGLAGSMGIYGPILKSAATRHRVFALDLPGFGSSVSLRGRHSVSAFVEDLVDFIQAIAPEPIHLVCHSLGGQICMWLALDHPELITTLTLIDPAGTYEPRAFVERMSRGLLGSVRPEKDALMQIVLGLQDGILPHLVGFDPLMLASFSSFDANLGARVRRLRVPTLLIWGEHDELFGIDVALSLKENVPGSVLRVVSGGDHSPQLTHPELVLDWILDFHAQKTGQQ